MTDYKLVPVELLSELAESLASELDARYPASVRSYESQDRKYQAEMEPVLTARQIIAAAPAVQGEPVAVVDAADDGMWADILPNVTVKVGQTLYAAPQPAEQKPASSPWSYCPECGSEHVQHHEGEHKQCANCHQEWFSGTDYTDVVRKHLAGKFRDKDAEIERLRSSESTQPAPNPLAKGYFHPLPDENDYEFHDAERFPEGNDCPVCIPALIVRKSELASMPAPDVAGLVEAESVPSAERMIDELLCQYEANGAAPLGRWIERGPFAPLFAALAAHRNKEKSHDNQ